MSRLQSSGRRPRLGVDLHVFDELFQGSRSHLLGLYSAAVGLAPDLDFVFFLDQVDRLAEEHPVFAGPNVRRVRMPARPGPVRLGLQLPWLQWRHGIDLLHMQYRLPLVPAGPCACTIHDVLFETHPQFFTPGFVQQSKLTYRWAARRAAVLLTVSAFSRQEIARHYDVPAERIGLTYNAVDRQRFRPGPDGLEALQAHDLTPGGYLLTVGRLEPRKNHATLVDAYARLGADAPPLVIVGQRDFSWGGLFDAIERHQLGTRVRVLESVSDADLPALLRHARLFVYPTLAEGFGMPVLEAMASGVPVITSTGTSLPEVAGSAAWLVEPTSVDALAEALRTLLADPVRCARMREAGRIQADRFDWAISANELLARVRAFFSSDSEPVERRA